MVTVRGSVAEFCFHRPGASHVFLVGDFNGWRESELQMGRDDRGFWTARLHLPPGEYRFRYLVDGRWFTDYAAFGVKEGIGGVDSVVWVRPTPEQAARGVAAGPSVYAGA